MGRTALRLLAAALAVAVLGGVAVAMSGRSSVGHPASRAWVHVWHAKRPATHRHHPSGSGTTGTTGTVSTGSTLTPVAATGTTPGTVIVRPQSLTVTSPAESARWRIAPVVTGDVWATSDDAGALVLAHWDGSAWHRQAVPASLGLPTVDTLALARPRGGVWLVGRAGSGVRIVVWNGRGYASAPAPDVPLGDCVTTGVAGVATTADAGTWLAGTAAPYGGCRRTVAFVERWNERAWQRSQLPVGIDSRLAGLAGTGDGRLWAYGAADRARALLLTYDGRGWRPVRVTALAAPIIAAAPDGDGGLWFATATSYAHLDAAGWHGFALPRSRGATITSLAWAPGTRTVWVYGGQATAPASANGGLAATTVLARLTA
jgi:hypothetical protein